jgi:superfamily II DNA or RNA helicase
VIELPPGAGKTLISGAILKEVLHPKEYGLFVVPWLHLVEQTHKVLTKYFFSPWDVGIVQGSINQVGRHITVASADTLRQPGRLEQLLEAQKRPMSAAIYDECHRALSETYRHIDTALSPYALKVGPSATPYRADRKSLVSVFPDDISYSISFFDLILQGYLTNIRSYDVETSLDLSAKDIEGLDGEEELGKLSPALRKKLETTNRYSRAYEVWRELTYGEKRTLVFAQDLKDAYGFTEYFQQRGSPADIITGTMGIDRRHSILAKFKSGEVPVLVNYNVLSTGADIPEIECIIIGRLMSQGLFTQACGRGLRLCPEIGKTECLLLNLVDRHHSLVTMGRLIGVEGDTILSLKKTMKEKVEADVEEREVVTLEENESKPFSLSVKVAEVRVQAYNVLCGAGWTADPVTGDFHKDCKEYGTLDAFRTFVGYSVRHRSKGGRISWISRDPIEADRARAMAHEHVERLKNTSAKRNGTHPDLVKPITEGQWQHLKQRKVGGMGKSYQEAKEAGLLQSHYFQIENHLKAHGSAYSKTGGTIKYDVTTCRVRTIPVKLTSTR